MSFPRCLGANFRRSLRVPLRRTRPLAKRRMYSSASQRRHRFHRLGLIVAAIMMAIGLSIIASGVVRLKLWEVLQYDTPAILLGLALVLLAVVCLAVYGVVRTIGWAIRAR